MMRSAVARLAPRASNALVGARSFSSEPTLHERLAQLIPENRAMWTEIKQKHGSKSLGEVTVDQAIGGARGVKCMIWETSLLDAEEGIRFRGYTIPELQKLLPDVKGTNTADNEPLPEGILWLLLTGEQLNHLGAAVEFGFQARSLRITKWPGSVMSCTPELNSRHTSSRCSALCPSIPTQ